VEVTKKQWLIGLTGTIVLGAVGSGVWDVFLKPAFSWLGREVLTLVTLGLSSVKDSMYQDIAKGHHEVAGLNILVFATAVFVFLPMGFVTGVWTARRRLSDPNTMTAEANIKYRKRMSLAIVPVYALWGSIFFVRFLMINYTNLAVTYFQQSLAICKPYIDSKEQDQILSRFARTRTKRDYESVVASLHLVAKSNHLELPEFDPW